MSLELLTDVGHLFIACFYKCKIKTGAAPLTHYFRSRVKDNCSLKKKSIYLHFYLLSQFSYILQTWYPIYDAKRTFLIDTTLTFNAKGFAARHKLVN